MDIPSKVHLDCFPLDPEDDGSGPEELRHSLPIANPLPQVHGCGGRWGGLSAGAECGQDGLCESDCAVYLGALTLPSLLYGIQYCSVHSLVPLPHLQRICTMRLQKVPL